MTVDIAITPVDRPFDVTALRDWLDARPDTFEDPACANRYLVNGYTLAAAFAREDLLDNPAASPYGCVVYLSETHVGVVHELGGLAALRSTLDFVDHVVTSYRCSVRVDDKTDLTAQIDRDGARSLYPQDIVDAPLPWAHTLIGVGLFHELEHGWPFGPSLRRACRDAAGPDDAMLVAYLDAGRLYRRATADAFDIFDGSEPITPPHLLTDGTYIWPADLAHYVRTHHVELPRAFVIHVRAHGGEIPENVHVASLPDFRV